MKKVMKELNAFREERNWKQFHLPRNLAKSIVIEASELLENFQWKNQKENQENVKEELADIMSYCLLMCQDYGWNPEDIIFDKIEKNKIKYPKDKAYGKANKYNKL